MIIQRILSYCKCANGLLKDEFRLKTRMKHHLRLLCSATRARKKSYARACRAAHKTSTITWVGATRSTRTCRRAQTVCPLLILLVWNALRRRRPQRLALALWLPLMRDFRDLLNLFKLFRQDPPEASNSPTRLLHLTTNALRLAEYPNRTPPTRKYLNPPRTRGQSADDHHSHLLRHESDLRFVVLCLQVLVKSANKYCLPTSMVMVKRQVCAYTCVRMHACLLGPAPPSVEASMYPTTRPSPGPNICVPCDAEDA